ncbi:MAG: signal peptidase I [Phycisphaerae bacterium]|jgi:hypothetical protein|nr:signal peptidase I [Phycisphaerae bacterium]MBT6165812.1 signal peptidase I [Phycisphaerae bacterium]MBT7657671.1 signal peptidase I [Phycisphaerae bacterium]
MLAAVTTNTPPAVDLGAGEIAILTGGFLIVLIIAFALQLIAWAGLWKTANKANQVGILACIPVVQIFIFALMAGRPIWWAILCFIPIVNIIIIIIILNNISKRFNRGVGTTLGLIFLPFIFWPILGFGSAQYSAD